MLRTHSTLELDSIRSAELPLVLFLYDVAVPIRIAFPLSDSHEPARAVIIPEMTGDGVHNPTNGAVMLGLRDEIHSVVPQSPVLGDGVQQRGGSVLDSSHEVDPHVALAAGAEFHLGWVCGEVDHELARDPARGFLDNAHVGRRRGSSRAGGEQGGAERQEETQHGGYLS